MLLRSKSRPSCRPALRQAMRKVGLTPMKRRPRLLGQPPLERRVGPHRVAVDHHDRCAHEQRGHERVPHHPRGGREPQQAPAGLEVPAQADALEVLDELAAVAVHDRLRQPGGARREEHVERVVEGDGLERRARRARPAGRPTRRRPGARSRRRGRARRARAVGRPARISATCSRRSTGAVAVGVAADREQHLGLDLAEARQHAARAELRRARRPRRPEAGGGQEGDERLGDVRQVGDDAVAGADAEAPQPRARPRDLVAQLAEGQLDRLARLRARDDGHPVGVLVGPQRVLGVVQARAREPLGAGHLRARQDALVGRVRAHAEEVPDRAPEALEVVDRPAPQRVVVREVASALVAQPVQVAPDLGRLAHVRGRGPEHVADHGRHVRTSHTSSQSAQRAAY